MPKIVKSNITGASKRWRRRLQKRQQRQRANKTIEETEEVEEEDDEQGEKGEEGKMEEEEEDDDDELFIPIQRKAIKFGPIQNGIRSISFKDENITIFGNTKVVKLQKWSKFSSIKLKPIPNKTVFFLDDLDEHIFVREGYCGSFEDIFQLLTYQATPNVIVDAYMHRLINADDGYVPITGYTHFQDHHLKCHPKFKLPASIIKKDRIVCPMNTRARGIGHTYLCIIYPTRYQVDVFDSSPEFTSKEVKAAHIDVILNQLHKGDKVPEYLIREMDTPVQTDDYSCAIIMMYVFNNIKSTIQAQNKIIRRPTQANLDGIRQEIAALLLTTTPAGRQLMNYLVC
ncbi:unnamed protein product [Orchesella dallaii]|uniref:Ubiquitin-like protease family profile domain-containing protein n=1 Tax=Orchesella dallaii TaxID=48710 RepID=A0ABP1PSP6_9HEXA